MSNEIINFSSFSYFLLQILIILLISVTATIGLSFLLSRIKHNVKFIPIIAMIVLIYTIAKFYHLPGLIFILILGLVLGNIQELKHFSKLSWFKTDNFHKEIHRFKELITEFTFLVRTLFFLLFGFLIRIEELINLNSLPIAMIAIGLIVAIRFATLKFYKLDTTPLLYIAPRGLITILLFLYIPLNSQVAIISKSLIIQVVVLSSILMMIGMLRTKSRI